MKVLVVEDDAVLSSVLVKTLNKAGYKAHAEREGNAGLETAMLDAYGLIILDIMLPGMNGYKICEALRSAGIETPILMLTAKDAIDDRVKGLDTGADDYLVKPFDVNELLARVRALTRREAKLKSQVFQVDDLTIDSLNHSAERAGRPLNLTPREFSLLEALARNVGRTLTREAILERVWNSEENLPNSVNFHMSSLRKKLEKQGERQLIHTIHGVGYVMKWDS